MLDSTNNFDFLRDEFPALYTLGKEAEFQLHLDSAAALFKLRLFGEKLVDRLFTEHQLPVLADNTQHRRLGELKRHGLLPRQVEDILHLIKQKGNAAAHQNAVQYAIAAYRGLVREVYEVTGWNQKGDRWEFLGKPAAAHIRDKYLNQSLENYIKKGAQNPVRYSF